MADIDLTTTATVPSGTNITITVYEDVDGDGEAENQASQAVEDGTNTYALSGFEFESGNEFWLEAEFDTDDVTKTAELDSAGLAVDPVERVSAKATTLTLLPGYNENSRDPDGDDLNSAIPDLSILDESFIGDNRLSLPKKLDEAIEATRGPFPEYPGKEFKAYRLMNQIELCFETEDGKTISDWSRVNLRTNDDPDPETGEARDPSKILVEGETDHGENNPVRNLINDPDRDWFNGQDALDPILSRSEEGSLTRESNLVTLNGVEGVRTSLIRGARDTFIVEMRKKFLELGEIEFRRIMRDVGWRIDVLPAFFAGVPVFYTFIELVLMADEARLVRVWDASRYPKHYLYADKPRTDQTDRPDQTDFEDGEEWEKNEIVNTRFAQFVDEERDSRTPFTPRKERKYEWDYNRTITESIVERKPPAWGRHPVMRHALGGDVLTKEELLNAEEFSTPHFPWH